MSLVAVAACSEERPAPPLMFGISHATQWNLDSLYRWDEPLSGPQRLRRLAVDMNRLGTGWYRPNFNWREVTAELRYELQTVDDVVESMVADAAAGEPDSGFDWTTFDFVLDVMDEHSIRVLPVLANSDDWRLPRLPGSEDAANPDAIGKQAYLAQLHLYTRATVRRYRGRANLWQIENELNAASFTRLVSTGRKGDAWGDEEFLDDIIETMAAAVRQEDGEAVIMTNFHTDVFEWIHDWRDTLERWEPTLDWIGLDSYPNYLDAEPIGWPRVAEVVEQARSLVSRQTPVLVLETGYPSNPLDDGYTEQGQALYLGEALRAAVDAGATGLFVYTMTSPEQLEVFGNGAQEPENYWGLIRMDGVDKPAFRALRDAIDAVGLGY